MGLKGWLYVVGGLTVAGTLVAGYLFVTGMVDRIALLEAESAKLELAIDVQKEAIEAQQQALEEAVAAQERANLTLEEQNNVRSEIRDAFEDFDGDPNDFQYRLDCLFSEATGAGNQDCSSRSSEGDPDPS